MRIKGFILLLSSLLFMSFSKLDPTDLSCEHQQQPLIDNSTPQLSWKNISKDGGGKQSAYRIRVVKHEGGKSVVVWDSGKVLSDKSLYIPYGGKPLISSCDYSWQVKVWDSNNKASQWSDMARWHTGKFSAEDWKAQWIGVPWQGEDSYDIEWAKRTENNSRPRANLKRIEDVVASPLFRKEFEVKRRVRSARFYGTGLGYFELYLNGERIGNDYLSPNQTNYTKRPLLGTRSIVVEDPFNEYIVMYLSYDLTPYIQQGNNCIGAILGNGFYNLMEYWPAMSYGTPRLFGQIEIEYTDGTREIIATDPSWRCTKSAITADQIYLGEHYDARLEHKGWATANYDDSQWEQSVVKQTPYGKLVAQNGPADRIIKRYKPTAITKQEDGSLLVSFPEEISGWVEIKDLELARGQKIDIKYVNRSFNGTNSYIAKGEGKESYHARFTWFVFPQVEIRGIENISPEQIEAHAVSSDVASVAEFHSSNKTLNALHKAWRLTQLDNMHGSVPSDCPHRERSAYTGDGQLASMMAMHNFDVSAFYNKWMRDIRGAQIANGYVTNTAPWQPGSGGGPGWGSAIAIIPWEYYMHYGDTRVLKENYTAIKDYIAWAEQWVDADGIMEVKEKVKWVRLGDWLSPDDNLPHPAAVHTFYYYICVDIAAKIAEVFGNSAELSHYTSLRERTVKAYHNRFYNAEERTYGNYGSNVLALRMGMPEEYQKIALEALKRNIAEANGHFFTGIISTRYLFDMLCEMGEVDTAYSMMNKRTMPSFGYWMEQGSTTIWEGWGGRKGLSRNHPMWGGAMTWIYRYLGGLKATEPGFRSFEIAPLIPKGLTHLSYSLDTVYGKIELAWRIENGLFMLDCTVPVGTTATIKLPYGGSIAKVDAGKHSFKTSIAN